jgi:hypothetical protein
MLKFIRKYQLFILVIGGSLLMVVFLLEPVLTRLSPSPMKAKIATMADGSTFRRGDIQNANVAISLLSRVNPRALGARNVGGMGLDQSSESNTALHWLMLVKQAEDAGLVGESGDGAGWIEELATVEAQIQLQSMFQQGQANFQTPEEAELFLQATRDQYMQIMSRNASLSASNAGGTMEDVYRILAQARGVYRMLASVQSLPAFSDLGAIDAAHTALDAVAVNAAIINSSLISSTVGDPGDETLQTFFETYKDLAPSENEYNIGYTQPTRIQLGWLTLDKNTFMNAVKVDRIELNKIWRQDRVKYPGDFAAERLELERQFREDLATDMMIEADRIIRAQVLAKTNGLPSKNGILELPEDWESQRPRLEQIADIVTERISEQFSVVLTRPSVDLIGDRWLNANSIRSLRGIGLASYRVGSRQIQTQFLPQFFELTEDNTTGLDVQVGLPLVDPAAEDQIGNRYYAVVLDVRARGGADEIGDVGRERVLADYQSVEAYKSLSAMIAQIEGEISANADLAPSIDMAMSLSEDPLSDQRPGVYKNILVLKETIDPGTSSANVDPRLNTEEFRNAVREAAENLDPLASPEDVLANPIPVVVAIPSSRSIAIALVVAPRPATNERFTQLANSLIRVTAQRELVDAGFAENDPFSFAALSKRFELTRLESDDDDAIDSDTESESESESESQEPTPEGDESADG